MWDVVAPRVAGVGNTAFPLLAADPTAVVYCCDFSPRAVAGTRPPPRPLTPTHAHSRPLAPLVHFVFRSLRFVRIAPHIDVRHKKRRAKN